MAEPGHGWQLNQNLDAIRYDWRSDVASGASKKHTESVTLHRKRSEHKNKDFKMYRIK